mmetsp:Transcript_14631/g.39582  ORF Transcript_14631/g.39582 Transcript_14631/m.39582 type:complete len:146 (+) Transcript_14631:56-493(+)
MLMPSTVHQIHQLFYTLSDNLTEGCVHLAHKEEGALALPPECGPSPLALGWVPGLARASPWHLQLASARTRAPVGSHHLTRTPNPAPSRPSWLRSVPALLDLAFLAPAGGAAGLKAQTTLILLRSIPNQAPAQKAAEAGAAHEEW